jgi:hypothetical protein
LFAGYSRHARILWKLANANVASGLVNTALPNMLLRQSGSLGEWSYRVKQNVDRSDVLRNYTYSRSIAPLSNSVNFLSPELLDQIDSLDLFFGQYKSLDKINNTTDLNNVLALEVQGFMGSVLLRDMDATSMWHSLEVRFPLIDYKLVELAFSLPDAYKLDFNPRQKPQPEGTLSYRQAGNKKILMDAMEPFLPAGFADRPKNGFKLPISHWLKSYKREELKAMVMDERSVWKSYLNTGQIEALFHVNNNESNNLLWKVLCFVKTVRV